MATTATPRANISTKVVPEAASDARQVCIRCVMDTTDPAITFDDLGMCSHCIEYDRKVRGRVVQRNLADSACRQLIDRIKRSGRGKEYDCIVGVSGGVDSTYAAYVCKQLGLRCLAVHFDNGWNSELAVSNIEKVLSTLDMDLDTHVMDWEEFRDLQLSFLKAATPDGEIPTDHAIYGLLMRTARKYGIRYVVSGTNFRTEGSRVEHWSYGHSDWRYIKAIHARFGTRKLRDYPHFGLWQLFYTFVIKRVRFVSILNYVEYNKQLAKQTLAKELRWRDYGGKHYESVYTRFYQGYVLPTKFGIDKRKMHLSDLIRDGQIDRQHALAELVQSPYADKLLREDKQFTLKKLGLDDESFAQLMEKPNRCFHDYPSSRRLIYALLRILRWAKKVNVVPK